MFVMGMAWGIGDVRTRQMVGWVCLDAAMRVGRRDDVLRCGVVSCGTSTNERGTSVWRRRW